LAVNLFEHGRFGFTADGSATTYRGPIFPVVLGLVNLCVGHIGVTTILVNCLASALTCVVVYFLAQLVFGRGRALLQTLPAVFFPLSIYYCTSSFSDTFFALTVALYFLLVVRMFERPGPARGIFAGIGFALAALTKGLLLPLPVLLVGYALVRRRAALAATLVSVVVGFALVGFWTVRNYAVDGHVIPISVGPGFSMLAGNFMIDEPTDAEEALKYGERQAFERINRKYGTDFTRASLKTAGYWDIPPETDKLFFREAWSMFAEERLLLPRKLLINSWRFWYFSGSVLKSRANWVVNYPLLALALLCCWKIRRRRASAAELLLLFAAAFMLIYAMVNVCSSRYSLPVLLLLIPYAAWFVLHIFRQTTALPDGGGPAAPDARKPAMQS
jgi:4-amino-4-deoxy-L-arabinose transferase-like glycosyltransferase